MKNVSLSIWPTIFQYNRPDASAPLRSCLAYLLVVQELYGSRNEFHWIGAHACYAIIVVAATMQIQLFPFALMTQKSGF